MALDPKSWMRVTASVRASVRFIGALDAGRGGYYSKYRPEPTADRPREGGGADT